jgi:long-chain acyl-CoA synthetase
MLGAMLAPTCIPDLLDAACATFEDLPALRMKRDGAWWTTSYGDLRTSTRAVAASLAGHGVESGDRVAIFAPNSPEWTIADIAVMTAGAVTVPIYATSVASQVSHILRDSGAVALFVAPELLPTFTQVLSQCPQVRLVIVVPSTGDGHGYAGHGHDAEAASRVPDASGGPRVVTLEELEGESAGRSPDEVDALLAGRRAQLTRESLCALVYTSGTTGEPKGVMLTHGNLLHQGREITARFELVPGERSMCFLPLSHAYERAWTLVIVLAHGLENTYVRNPREVAAELKEIAPQVFVSVPRLYEKVYDVAVAQAGVGRRREIFDWALRVGMAAQSRRFRGEPLPRLLAARYAVADRLVLRKVRDALGGHKRVMAAGGAPLRREVEEFFFAAGEVVYNGYGLTETAPVVSCNAPGALRFGTVGLPLPGCQVRIGSDGEIHVRGENVMRGYWGRPQDTAAALDDGWFRTGDVGRLDARGYLVITDRIKDIIVTAQGKNIAPQPIEGALAADPLVDVGLVIGDGRPYITAVLQPVFAELERLAKSQGWPGWPYASYEGLVRAAPALAYYATVVDRVNATLPHHEQIKRFRLLAQELTMSDGALTPTLKIRRRIVTERYADLIDEMYASPE